MFLFVKAVYKLYNTIKISSHCRSEVRLVLSESSTLHVAHMV